MFATRVTSSNNPIAHKAGSALLEIGPYICELSYRLTEFLMLEPA